MTQRVLVLHKMRQPLYSVCLFFASTVRGIVSSLPHILSFTTIIEPGAKVLPITPSPKNILLEGPSTCTYTIHQYPLHRIQSKDHQSPRDQVYECQ